MDPLCRLCEGKTHFVFSKLQLKKYNVSYYECEKCHSLQTEHPYWIEEAYGGFFYATDTGMIERTLASYRLALTLAHKKKFSREDTCIDIGGGPGLLTRLLRDRGLNAFWSDKYAVNVFSVGFDKNVEEVSHPKLFTAFEVFEHFAHPAIEIEHLLTRKPEHLLFSTKLYQRQGVEWWYLLEDGQHLQFYSSEGLHSLANRFEYYYQNDGSTYHLLSRNKEEKHFLKNLLKVSATIEDKVKKRWPSRTWEDHQLRLQEMRK